MHTFAPVVPGLTEGAEGSEQTQTLAMLAMMRMRNPKKFEALFDSLQKLVTPQEPPPEPDYGQIQPPSGQGVASLLGQPSGGQPMGL